MIELSCSIRASNFQIKKRGKLRSNTTSQRIFSSPPDNDKSHFVIGRFSSASLLSAYAQLQWADAAATGGAGLPLAARPAPRVRHLNTGFRRSLRYEPLNQKEKNLLGEYRTFAASGNERSHRS